MLFENGAGEEALAYRKKYRGVIGITSKIPIKDVSILSLVYTPGVAEPCLEIARDPVQSFSLSCRGNSVGILTDGSGLFRLGHAGPEAALPVMEGKAVIFKTFAGVDAIPICLRTQDPYNSSKRPCLDPHLRGLLPGRYCQSPELHHRRSSRTGGQYSGF